MRLRRKQSVAYWLSASATMASIGLWVFTRTIDVSNGAPYPQIRIPLSSKMSLPVDLAPNGLRVLTWGENSLTPYIHEGPCADPMDIPTGAFWLPHINTFHTFIESAFFWPCWAITAPLLATTLALRRWPPLRSKPGHCAACGYDLVGASAGSTCPECGLSHTSG